MPSFRLLLQTQACGAGMHSPAASVCTAHIFLHVLAYSSTLCQGAVKRNVAIVWLWLGWLTGLPGSWGCPPPFLGALRTSLPGYFVFSNNIVSASQLQVKLKPNSVGKRERETPEDEELSPGHFLHFFLFIVCVSFILIRNL